MRFAALVPTVLLGAVTIGCSGRTSAPPANVPGTTTLTNANLTNANAPNANAPPREKLILPEVNFDDVDEDEGTDGPNDLVGPVRNATYALHDGK